ncbi:hypothetical protein [Mycobacterium paraseoulense]|uniref:Uncharacterized protein n=1 Tax=Mycobacterium paraseoulense TaxID=590652 RepID=A0A1X0I6A9_9MYCO|nr:hypothetical protein [Mycobacterium paraseoulense]MCV7396966.1 hypothetical protein [Mycobacterium paraseoulense]ORB36455.1 hypothetical protein BST39_20790 [Mycobacterium paraseoulense]BBZ69167.1 hypothetical protein MPRS_02600 [Mycobacterium paraseoulense]
MTSDNIATRRFPAGVAAVSGLVGLVLGALATFAITGLVWTVRVQLPPPPYPPPLSSQSGGGCVYPTPPSPTSGTGVAPAPPLPPAPHA